MAQDPLSSTCSVTSPLHPSFQRTNGDGMENPDTVENTSTSTLACKLGRLSLGEQLIYRRPPELDTSCSLEPPKIPLDQLIPLIPVNHISESRHYTLTKSSLKSMREKEPKFVPYEPYKAAVTPIMPLEVSREKVPRKHKKKKSGGLGAASTCSVEAASVVSIESKDETGTCSWERLDVLVAELEALRSQNQELDKQLRFQIKVNCELKTMLVAAVGEDVEVRVQHLTEDKLHLARALLNSSDDLSSNQEQIERLAGQCEVWRSKFLASSLMVEELARWKAAMNERNHELINTMSQLLQERIVARSGILQTFKNLEVLRENFDPASGLTLATSPHRWPSTSRQSRGYASSKNLLDVAAASQRLSECLSHRLLGSAVAQVHSDVDTGTSLSAEACTSAEKKAQELLQRGPVELLGHLPDSACSAVVGAAAAANGGLFPHISCTPTTCCAHCSGEIQVL